MTHDSHPDLLALDAHRAGERAPGVAEHLARCEDCAAHLELQRALSAELGAAPPSISVPAAQDAALRAAARGRAAEFAAPSRSRWAWVAAAGAVTAVAAALLLLFARGGSSEPAAPRIAVAPVHGDINRDGQLDVIDALVLARLLDSGQLDGAGPGRDLNGDGAVDHADVAWISKAVVSVRRAR